MGVRLSCRKYDGILFRGEREDAEGVRMVVVGRQVRSQNASGRSVETERLGAPRYARECVGVVCGLVRKELLHAVTDE